MFEIDAKGLAELEGGKPAHRLAFEPVANVFDEFRGYSAREKPSYCAVTLRHSKNPRGVYLTVADDGAGFENVKDVWTLFGTTAKRSEAGVSGRFNAGDKQLIAAARSAIIKTNGHTVMFEDGERKVHQKGAVRGVIVETLMNWSLADMDQVAEQLKAVIPPRGLKYTVNGERIDTPPFRVTVKATLPTVLLADGVMRPTTRQTFVDVLKTAEPTLYELGVPVCSLEDTGFPWSLNVCQKVPVPLSRDTVSPAYLFRLIGSVIEAADVEGVRLLTEDEQGAAFVKGAMDWVREPEALEHAVKSLYGEQAVRQSSDPVANAQAAASGATLVSGRWFTPDTRRRMESTNVLPTSKERFGGSENLVQAKTEDGRCGLCGRPFTD